MSYAAQPLSFRPFAAEDARLLGTLLAGAGLGVPAGVATASWAGRLVNDPNISCWVACIGRRVVGFFRLDTGPDRQAEVTLIVAPVLRRQGIGRRLLDECLTHARARGLRRILAVVQAENTVAIEFFEDAGFRSDGAKTPGNVHLQRLIHRGERQPPLEIHP
jgi:ribosomal protein S18 acetylase RimI-like enzyme